MIRLLQSIAEMLNSIYSVLIKTLIISEVSSFILYPYGSYNWLNCFSEGSQIWNLRTIWELVKKDGIFLSLWTSFSLLNYGPLFTNLEVMVKAWWKCGGNYPPRWSTGISSGFATLQVAFTFLLLETRNTIFSLRICLVFIQTASAGIFPNNTSPGFSFCIYGNWA